MASKGGLGDKFEAVVATMPVGRLVVGLQRGRASIFTLATIPKDKTYGEIYCFCDDPARRNKWIAVFRRMAVSIFDMRL